MITTRWISATNRNCCYPRLLNIWWSQPSLRH